MKEILVGLLFLVTLPIVLPILMLWELGNAVLHNEGPSDL